MIFASSGRIEGPGSSSYAFRLEGPLGSQDLPPTNAAKKEQVQIVPLVGEAAKAEAASTSGVPAATRAR
jgi:hypothetical protein